MKSIDKQVFEPAQRLIKYFGSQKKVVEAMGVTQGTVSGWKRKVHGVDSIHAKRAERLTGGVVKAHELCPALAEFEDAIP
jgi:DNA-binding transcriptional regulator YdaS (Cro superfamily)